MLARLFALLVAVAVFAPLGAIAAEARNCAPYAALKSALEKRFKEHRDARGLSSDGRLVEVFVGPNGSWTILITDPDGLACIAAAGEGWQKNLHAATEPSA